MQYISPILMVILKYVESGYVRRMNSFLRMIQLVYASAYVCHRYTRSDRQRSVLWPFYMHVTRLFNCQFCERI